jgi:hypothetical protein
MLIAGLSAAGGAAGIAHADEQPKKVTGVSFALDTMRTGNTIGGPEVYAIAMSALGSALPAQGTFGPLDPTVQQAAQQVIIAAGSQGATVAQMSQAGDAGFAQLENAVQPLAAINAPANQVIDAAAGAMDTAATAAHAQIQPFDVTVKQAAQLIQELKAPS